MLSWDDYDEGLDQNTLTPAKGATAAQFESPNHLDPIEGGTPSLRGATGKTGRGALERGRPALE
ncbi:MAG: hypothetical protein OXJ53_16325, partial [Gammaproteobacteria bacterium]|nr:hypothetical protein [Gammaproteobacteria bacterium]